MKGRRSFDLAITICIVYLTISVLRYHYQEETIVNRLDSLNDTIQQIEVNYTRITDKQTSMSSNLSQYIANISQQIEDLQTEICDLKKELQAEHKRNNELKNQLESVGGESFLNDLSDLVMSGGNIEFHAKIVLDKALLRQLIFASNKIIEECYKSDYPVPDIIDEAEQMIFKVAERPGFQSFVKINQIIPETLRNIEETAQTKKSVSGVPTGFPDLDSKIGGFRPGQLIVIAARPAMGKTSFALNIAFNAAMYNDKKVGIFTMEMEHQFRRTKKLTIEVNSEKKRICRVRGKRNRLAKGREPAIRPNTSAMDLNSSSQKK